MANVVQNEGFETVSDWTLSIANAAYSTDTAAAGSYSLKLSSGGFCTQTVTAGTSPTVGFAAYAFSAGAGTSVQLSVTDLSTRLVTLTLYADGTLTRYWNNITLGTSGTDTLASPGNPQAGWVTVASDETAFLPSGSLFVRFQMSTGANSWYVDEVSVLEQGEQAVITEAIITGLASDLAQITTGNGYSLTVATVGREPVKLIDADSPGVYIASSEGASELGSVASRIGEAEQDYELWLVLKNPSSPNSAMNDFLDDVRNSIERGAGNVLAVSGVDDAAVTSWTPAETGSAEHEGVYVRTATVTVQYRYTRGSA